MNNEWGDARAIITMLGMKAGTIPISGNSDFSRGIECFGELHRRVAALGQNSYCEWVDGEEPVARFGRDGVETSPSMNEETCSRLHQFRQATSAIFGRWRETRLAGASSAASWLGDVRDPETEYVWFNAHD